MKKEVGAKNPAVGEIEVKDAATTRDTCFLGRVGATATAHTTMLSSGERLTEDTKDLRVRCVSRPTLDGNPAVTMVNGSSMSVRISWNVERSKAASTKPAERSLADQHDDWRRLQPYEYVVSWVEINETLLHAPQSFFEQNTNDPQYKDKVSYKGIPVRVRTADVTTASSNAIIADVSTQTSVFFSVAAKTYAGCRTGKSHGNLTCQQTARGPWNNKTYYISTPTRVRNLNFSDTYKILNGPNNTRELSATLAWDPPEAADTDSQPVQNYVVYLIDIAKSGWNHAGAGATSEAKYHQRLHDDDACETTIPENGNGQIVPDDGATDTGAVFQTCKHCSKGANCPCVWEADSTELQVQGIPLNISQHSSSRVVAGGGQRQTDYDGGKYAFVVRAENVVEKGALSCRTMGIVDLTPPAPRDVAGSVDDVVGPAKNQELSIRLTWIDPCELPSTPCGAGVEALAVVTDYGVSDVDEVIQRAEGKIVPELNDDKGKSHSIAKRSAQGKSTSEKRATLPLKDRTDETGNPKTYRFLVSSRNQYGESPFGDATQGVKVAEPDEPFLRADETEFECVRPARECGLEVA